MTTGFSTGSSNHTVYIENGEEVLPCRCGKKHRPTDPYGVEDYLMHTCPHSGPLTLFHVPDGTELLMCHCGVVFDFKHVYLFSRTDYKGEDGQ